MMKMNQLIDSCSATCVNDAKTRAADIVDSLSAAELKQSIPSWDAQASIVEKKEITPDTTRAFYALVAYYCSECAKEKLSKP